MKAKKYTVTDTDLKRMKKNLMSIEAWRGSAYENDDEVGVAMQDMKTFLSMLVYGDLTEVCPHCEDEIEVKKPLQDCSNCGKLLLACGMCTMEYADGCAGQDEELGWCKNYDVDISEL